jgi:uncharacterized membrane protein YeaQ/YmgE (transglycosylase-associated protein family)
MIRTTVRAPGAGGRRTRRRHRQERIRFPCVSKSGCRSGLPLPTVAEENDMTIIIWLILGGVIGWLASILMRTDAQQGIILNIVVGIVGAFVGGFLFNHNMNSGDFTLVALVEAFIGAVILLAIVNLVRRGSMR